jgi:arylsulfatase A-like enzyme
MLLVIFVALAAGAVSADPRPINLLFILTDNQPASIIGAYGNPDVRTPHIDRLASEGMRFTSALAANGMCSPTRATLMTGLMPSQHGVHNWLDDSMLEDWPRDWSAIAEFRTLPLTLAGMGYDTAMIGKWHLGQPWQASIGFQHWVTFTDGHTVDFWNNTIIENEKTYAVEGKHTVDFFADKAIDYLSKREEGRPFYLQLNFNGPYLNPPSNLGPARNRHYASYLDSSFESFPRVAFNANVAGQLVDPDTPEFLVEKHLEAIAMHNDRATMANVASQNTMVDDAVGRVLTALEEQGLAESTLVVFSSDQGNFYGQHGLWQHTVVTSPSNLYEAALNIPLIIRYPGEIPAGEVNYSLIGQYDLPVTLLDYLGVDRTLGNSPGRSFAPLLRGEPMMWENEVFYEQEESRGIRTPEYAYWQRLQGTGEAELYDMRADPGQHRNIIDDPSYREIAERLHRRLTDFFQHYSDPKYDLWRGGVAKGSVIRVEMFRNLYGADWSPRTELLETFRE